MHFAQRRANATPQWELEHAGRSMSKQIPPCSPAGLVAGQFRRNSLNMKREHRAVISLFSKPEKKPIANCQAGVKSGTENAWNSFM
jgi:hypothetical protein